MLIRVVFFRIHCVLRNKSVNYDSFSIALMIAFDALNRLNKLVYDVFEYVQCFDLEI